MSEPTTPDPEPSPTTPPQDPPAPPPETPEPPPVTKIVVEGEISERELALQRRARELETKVSELEDVNHSLKDALKPRPQPRRKSAMEEFMGW